MQLAEHAWHAIHAAGLLPDLADHLAHVGDDANAVIKSQDAHLREAVAAGRSDHEAALREMKGRWRRPVSGMKWCRQVQRDFKALLDADADH